MRAYVKMRGEGVNEEYDFLGGEPEADWWSEFSGLVNWNGMGLAVTARTGEWRIYLASIPSGRRDTRGRSREFTLALTGSCGPPDASEVLPLVGLWLDEVVGTAGSTRLRTTFSDAFPDDAITRLRGRHTPSHQQERVQRFAEALRKLGPEPGLPDSEAPGTWWGLQEDDSDRHTFLDQVARLLLGKQDGVAIVGDLVYEVHVTGNRAPSAPVRALRDLWPGTASMLLVRSGSPQQMFPKSIPGRHLLSSAGEVVPGKAPAAPREGTNATPQEPGRKRHTKKRALTDQFLRRATWSCAGLAVLFSGVLIVLVLTMLL
ncbi:hypothetical protein [Streptomyces sp. NPDC020607]|uniref:hypothetical protein n=1 Tax=Streptomyces sp. NPDC020607 TaxID=3365082 RepID=UPI0037B63275